MKPLAGKWKRVNHGSKLVKHDSRTNLSNLRFADDIFSSAAHRSTRPPCQTTLPQLRRRTACNFALRELKSSPTRHQSAEEARDKNQTPWSTHHRQNAVQVTFEHRTKCARATTHEPQAGFEITNVPADRPTRTLRRLSDPITPPHLRHVDDDGRNEEEAPDNGRTDDEDDRTDRKNR